MAIQYRSRRQFELAVTTGWMAERFAREERLSGLQHYLKAASPMLKAEEEAAEMTRWAAGHGLEVVDIEDDD